MRYRSSQSGMVSILTVVFFMIFISVIVLGFIKIMTDEQRQATDNDLAASALAAAQSGIEDAKRIILNCKTSPVPPAQCTGGPVGGILNSGNGTGDCNVFSSVPGITSALGIDVVGGEVVVGDSTYRQSYTCLTINQDTPNVEKTLHEGKSEIIKLDVGPGGFDQLDFQWKGSGGPFGVTAASTLLPKKTSWLSGANTIPPLLRLQFIPYTPGSVSLNTVERDSRTAFIKPASTLATSNSITALDTRNSVPGMARSTTAPLIYANCPVLSPTAYECKKTLTGFDTAKSYYVRAGLMYGSQTDLTITASKGGAQQTFKFVQPQIDVTGRANDVYRRVKARVSFEAPNLIYPEYALESSSSICKRLTVADAASTQFNCP